MVYDAISHDESQSATDLCGTTKPDLASQLPRTLASFGDGIDFCLVSPVQSYSTGDGEKSTASAPSADPACLSTPMPWSAEPSESGEADCDKATKWGTFSECGLTCQIRARVRRKYLLAREMCFQKLYNESEQ